MKTNVLATALMMTLTLAGSVNAQPAKDPALQVAKPSLKTNFNFEDMVVTGKYQYADELMAVVEDDKTLDDLLGLREDFKDRLRKETKRK